MTGFAISWKQHGQPQDLVRRYIQKTVQDMLSYGIAVMRSVLFRLHAGIKFRQKFPRNSGFICHPEIIRMRRHKKLHQLCLDPLCTDVFRDSVPVLLIACLRSVLNSKSQLCGKTHCTHDTECILLKTLHRISHTADDLMFSYHPFREKDLQVPLSGLYAMALIVKSLRFRSSSRLEVNITSFG